MIAYLKLARPHQWLKNLMLYFPPFLSGAMLQPGLYQKGMLPLVSFCLASSAAYVFNDTLDAPRDRNHPQKGGRPVASGAVSPLAAGVFSLLLLAAGVSVSLLVPGKFFLFVAAYLAVSLCYSIKLKELPVVDLFCIASGFVVRLYGGGAAFGVVISDWLFLSVFFLSVFLSTGKRLCEKGTLGESAGDHRKSLEGYPEGFLDLAMALTGAAVLVTYTMYSLAKPPLVYTVPLCTFGLLRYIMRVKAGGGGDPTDALLKDLPLFLTGLSWAILVAYCIYR
ncbi:MAG TPA: decaprenyl-phosphate phosphoribosyltransferase [Geobacter sp.]|nr:decaprenyl-phosphate phosphoribosyltransferase [Geobacter sp.]